MTEPGGTWASWSRDDKAEACRRAIQDGAISADDVARILGAPSRNAVTSVCSARDIALPGSSRGALGVRRTRPSAAKLREARSGDAGAGEVLHPVLDPDPGAAIEPLNGVGVLLFGDPGRRFDQCAWLLPETEHLPIEERRCCGQPIPPESRQHLCEAHRALSRGKRTQGAEIIALAQARPDLKPAEIAKALKLPAGAVAVTLRHARERRELA